MLIGTTDLCVPRPRQVLLSLRLTAVPSLRQHRRAGQGGAATQKGRPGGCCNTGGKARGVPQLNLHAGAQQPPRSMYKLKLNNTTQHPALPCPALPC